MTAENVAADVSATAVAPGRWVLDPGSSSATFSVSNLGVKVVHGSVPITSGEADVTERSDSSPEGRLRSVQAVFALSELATGNARRDVDLAKPHLLDTERYPTMSFVGAGSDALVTGVLTVRGAEVPIELETSVTVDPTGVVSVTATTSFDRSPMGMKAPRFMIGRRIDVAITAVFEHRGPV